MDGGDLVRPDRRKAPRRLALSGASPRFLAFETPRTARVAVLGGPAEGTAEETVEGTAEGAARESWFVLHGYRQLAHRFLRRFEPVAGPELRVVAPEGLSRFYLAPGDRPHGASDPVGASWMTREERGDEIRDYVRYLDGVAAHFGEIVGEEEGAAAPPSMPGAARVPSTVLGFSQGAHTAARWVALGGVRPGRLVLWGAGLPGDLPPDAGERLRGLDLVLVRGEGDGLRNVEEEAREEAFCRAEGIRPRIVTHPGGHEIAEAVLRGLRTPRPG